MTIFKKLNSGNHTNIKYDDNESYYTKNSEKNKGSENIVNYFPYDRTLDNALYICGLASILITLTLFISKIVFGFDIRNHTFPCMLHALTGYYCPGCGGTRATIFLFTGHILKSLYYNPFVFYIAVTGGWFMISQTIYRLIKTSRRKFKPMTIRPSYIYIGIAILLGQCLIKNLILFIFHYSVF